MNIQAHEVEEGDFLVGLDNGYVFENVDAEDGVSLRDGRYSFSVGEGRRLIGFHDAQGEENYLILQDDHPVEVRR